MPEPTPYLIVAHVRTGGTFLCHCLDSHPDIYCARTEPLHRLAVWRKAAPELSDVQILRMVLDQPGYLAAACKVTYSQLSEEVLAYLADRGGRLIHLRRNAMEVVASVMLRQLHKAGGVHYPAHTREQIEPFRVRLHPAVYRDQVRACRLTVEEMEERLRVLGLPLLEVDYGALTGGRDATQVPTETAWALCDYLQVERRPLISRLRRVRRWPLDQVIENWEEIRHALEGADEADG